MAVGGSGDVGSVAMSWDGSAWRPLRVNPADGLSGISCTLAARCMATGSFVTASDRLVALTESWNGSSWRRRPASEAADSGLSDVSCVSAARCVAVGAIGYSATLAEAWNGTGWQVMPAPAPAGLYPGLDAVSCRGLTCLALGFVTTDAWVWNGVAWQAIPNGGGLTDVSCARPTYCMATGTTFIGDPGNDNPVSVAELWNGKNWQQVNPPGTGLNTVSCTSTSFCMAAGGSTAEIWNGTSWRTRKLPGPFGTVGPGITAVSCVRRSACMAVGNYLALAGSRDEGFNVAEFWNGTPLAQAAHSRTRRWAEGRVVHQRVQVHGRRPEPGLPGRDPPARRAVEWQALDPAGNPGAVGGCCVVERQGSCCLRACLPRPTLPAGGRGEPVSADRLIDVLWGNRQTANPANALQAQIGRLRRTLAADATYRSRLCPNHRFRGRRPFRAVGETSR